MSAGHAGDESIKDKVTGLILAGGQGRRMGGVDKGLQSFRGKRLIDHVYGRLAPQVAGIIVNANQNHDDYKTFGVRVVSDAIGNFAGPLAGLHAGLSVSRRPFLVSVPCDSPFLAADLVARLYAALEASNADIAVAKTGDQPHPVFCLARRSVLEHLTRFLNGGGRKIDAWYATLVVAEVAFDDEADAFSNINTGEELRALETIEQGTAGKMTSLQQITSCMDAYDPDALKVASARAAIGSFLTPIVANERLALRSVLGRVLGEDIVSTLDVPAHDNSAMDGYALRHADLKTAGETELRLAGSAFAGRPFEGKMGRRECVRIMTGAVMPRGADTVVIQEIVQAAGGKVRIPAGQKQGQNLRLAGEDLAAGKPVLKVGQQIGPAELGLIASLGLAEVTVRRRLRVAFFSTGDELVSVGTALKPGEVYDSNRYTLYGMLSRLNCDVIDMGVVRDDPASLELSLIHI